MDLCWQSSLCFWICCLSSVQFSHSVVSDSLRPYESQHARSPCPSPTPAVYSNSCPSSRWCHPTISSSVIPFSSCPLSLPASGSFPMSQLFPWGGQSTGVSALASFFPKKFEGWSPSEWTGLFLFNWWDGWVQRLVCLRSKYSFNKVQTPVALYSKAFRCYLYY